MGDDLYIIERKITEFWTGFFRIIFFFLDDTYKSLSVSFIHYAVFIIGFYYFFFVSNPRDTYRILFFIFILLGAFSYFIFNRCFFTSIELNLSKDKNQIQKIMDKYFGKKTEGNVSSKVVLSISSIVIGIILLRDYGII